MHNYFIVIHRIIHRFIIAIRSRGFAALTPGYRALAPSGAAQGSS